MNAIYSHFFNKLAKIFHSVDLIERMDLSFPFPNPLNLLKKFQQLLKRKVSIAQILRAAHFVLGEHEATEYGPKFAGPAFGGATA